MNYLFFDILITGHHSEYIGHLINYFKHHRKDGLNVFIVHPRFKAEFPYLASEVSEINNVQLVEVSEEEFQKSNGGSLIKRSFTGLKLVKKYADQFQADHVFLLSFNIFQISLIFNRPHFKISGILFLQFYRMTKANWVAWMKYARKYLITKLYVNNKQIERIFILNDPGSVDYLNRKFRKGLFHILNDPIPNLLPLTEFNIYDHYNIDPERKILLHLGALSDRKGTLEFIQSALFVRNELQSQLAILVAGTPGSGEMSEKIKMQINRVNNTTGIKAVYDNNFLANDKMKSILDQCYAIVIPYKNPEASSGILGHAAAADKPVITTGKGLLKELVETYRLGLLIDEVTPEQIAQKTEALLCQGHWKGDSTKFVLERTPENFASTIVI